jgi:hypothetical protein
MITHRLSTLLLLMLHVPLHVPCCCCCRTSYCFLAGLAYTPDLYCCGVDICHSTHACTSPLDTTTAHLHVSQHAPCCCCCRVSYACLAGLAYTPELYCCGVDVVGPSHVRTLLATIPAYWAPMKRMLIDRIGDAETNDELNRK